MILRASALALLTGAFLLPPAHASSALADRVLVLVNQKMPAENGTGGAGASVFVGEYYARRRGIPAANVIRLKTSTTEDLSYSDYQDEIEKPLKKLLDAHDGALRRKILYIVPTYGIPLKTKDAAGHVLALDSALAAMYASPDSAIRFANPYAGTVTSQPPHFDTWADQREAQGLWKMFLVTRLDGPNALIARGLVDKAITAETSLTRDSGVAYFDYQGTRKPSEWQYPIDENIRALAELSRKRGFRTVLHVQRESTCGANLHPAASYVYDPASKQVFVDAYGAQAETSFSFEPVMAGDIVVGIRNQQVNSQGNIAYLTLATADPQTYIKLTYPLAPFTGYSATAELTLEKIVGGASAARAVVKLDKSMTAAINGVTEIRIHLEPGSVSAYRNGALLATATDPAAHAIPVSRVAVSALCWDYFLSGFTVTGGDGKVLWNDRFATDTTSRYQWTLAPRAAPDALWAWGWYNTAFDAYRFVPGAVAAQLTSYTAGTLRTPRDPNPAVASVGDKRWGWNWAPRMLEEGVTATWGAVAEPYGVFYALGGNVLNHFWTGYNFGESFYLAQNVLRWTVVAVGDPLYAPRVFQPAGNAAANSNRPPR
ncbi:MAG TPA: TIGR03790 family protein [Bryobacteraceae bacterium]|nr:TIGR03790 family protein [Bryobacteraceae bacterium]